MKRFALGAYVALSLVTFLIYAWDKRQAVRGGWRVPEARLHLLSLVGGFAGAALAMALVRHKRQKLAFHLVVTLALALHAGAWAWWFLR